MVVVKKYKLIFVHIPKCGGLSVDHYFHREGLLEAEFHKGVNFDITLGFIQWRNPVVNLLKYVTCMNSTGWGLANGGLSLVGMETGDGLHRTLTDYEKEFNLRGYRSFALVRNPYDRMISLYYFVGADGIMSFESFCGEVGRSLRDSSNTVPVLRPQWEYLRRGDHLGVDYVIRLEERAQGFDEMCADGVIPGEVRDGLVDVHLNAKDRKVDRESLLTEKCKTLIYKAYMKDFQLLGYSR